MRAEIYACDELNYELFPLYLSFSDLTLYLYLSLSLSHVSISHFISYVVLLFFSPRAGIEYFDNRSMLTHSSRLHTKLRSRV